MKYFLNHITAILTGLFFLVAIAGYGQQDPIIESVNVDENGDVTIKWKALPDLAGETYIIERWEYYDPGGDQSFQRIDIVPATALFYIHENSGASLEKQIYLITLDDGTQTNKSEEMQTIFLEENIVYDECALTNTIRWTEFFSKFAPIEYKISASIDGGVIFDEIETLDAINLVSVGEVSTYGDENPSPAKTNIYEYTHQNLDPDNIYTYKVEAVYSVENETQSSGSNLQSRDTPAYTRPNPPFIKRVFVDVNGSILLEGEITGSGVINGLKVWRTESENSSNLAAYQSLAAAEIGSINYRDTDANTSETAYWYDLVLLDYCYDTIRGAHPHRSIFLTAEVLPNESVKLNWNAYQGWPVESYRLFRNLGYNTFLQIDMVNNLEFIDNTISQSPNTGEITYFVEASDQSDDEEIRSMSNHVTITFDSELFIPNAFKPGGITDVFKPISRFEPNNKYLFQIYNRWGQLIFETRDFNNGWDGNYNGSRVSRGTYIWTYQYTDSLGNDIKKRGSVTVVY